MKNTRNIRQARWAILMVFFALVLGDPSRAEAANNSHGQAQLSLTAGPSFADFHHQQLRWTPFTARNEAMTIVVPASLPQMPRVHSDWGQIGGMSSGDLSITEPNSANNTKNPLVNQFLTPSEIKRNLTAYGSTTSPAGWVVLPGPPGAPFWFTQPQVVAPVNGPQQWFPAQTTGVPSNDFYAGMAATTSAMITSESSVLVNYDNTQATTQAQTQQFGDASNDASNSNLQSAMSSAIKSLVNVANETASGAYGRAVGMVQTMYRTTFVPVAILLILPGALITQIKGVVKFGVINDSNDEDALSPFTGFLRTAIALFLIPATQLIVSYAIDIGNSMTEVMVQQVQIQDVQNWADAQTSKPKAATPAEQAKLDAQQSGKSAFKRAAFGFINSLFTGALVILIAYQVVMMCYLYLLGPIAAAFYAWPSTTNTLFKNVFTNWINGLVCLTLWRFWWSLIILCMCVRIQWLKDIGQYNPNSPWEGVVYTAFVVMLTYVPFMPFEYKPGSLVSALLDKAGQGGSSSGGSAGVTDPGRSASQPAAMPAVT
ncbi:MAG: hypothetical protein JST44_15240 [Cyanobacteria bacterium SZAS LIN-5]|nr:hypothetical protein [Cyanobacteria bacterium SZAS LIN-5]